MISWVCLILFACRSALALPADVWERSQFCTPKRGFEIESELPPMKSRYPLKETHLKKFNKDGFVFLKGLISRDEIEELLLQECAEAILDEQDFRDDDLSNLPFFRMANTWEQAGPFRRIVFSERVVKLAAELLNTPSVRLLEDVLFWKKRGQWQTTWHQDSNNNPLNTIHGLTIWISLSDRLDDKTGTLRFAKESWGQRYMCNAECDEKEQCYSFTEDWVKEKFETVPGFNMRAGDATVHWHSTVHGAAENDSDRHRLGLSIKFHDGSARAFDPQQAVHIKLGPPGIRTSVWLDDCKEGSTCDHPLVPIVYQKGKNIKQVTRAAISKWKKAKSDGLVDILDMQRSNPFANQEKGDSGHQPRQKREL